CRSSPTRSRTSSRSSASSSGRDARGGSMGRSVLAVAAVLAPLAVARAATWTIDPAHTSVQFSVRHMSVSNVRGEVTRDAGTSEPASRGPTHATIQATLAAASIDTREAKRDDHHRSADFLDAARYPTITFRSTRIEAAGEGRYRVTGDLTLHG